MSEFNWNGIFKLPDAALAENRRIPKTVLVKQAALTKTEQRTLDKVRRFEHFATVQKSTTRILSYADDERDVQSVVFLCCEMADSQAYAEVGRLLHKCFPNPTVLLIEAGGRACVSVALTRKSQAEQGATVVDRIESTGAFDLGRSEYAPLLDVLEFARLPQGNLLAFLRRIAWAVRLSRSVASLGFYPMCTDCNQEQLSELIARSDALAKQVSDNRQQRRDRGLSLNESARLRVDTKKLEAELDSVMDSIKTICTLGDIVE